MILIWSAIGGLWLKYGADNNDYCERDNPCKSGAYNVYVQISRLLVGVLLFVWSWLLYLFNRDGALSTDTAYSDDETKSSYGAVALESPRSETNMLTNPAQRSPKESTDESSAVNVGKSSPAAAKLEVDDNVGHIRTMGKKPFDWLPPQLLDRNSQATTSEDLRAWKVFIIYCPDKMTLLHKPPFVLPLSLMHLSTDWAQSFHSKSRNVLYDCC